MKDLIKLLQIMKEKYFSSCLVKTKRGIKELLHEINGADMTQWNNEKEILLRIIVNLCYGDCAERSLAKLLTICARFAGQD